MNKFILASHSNLAYGMKDALHMLTGKGNDIVSYGLLENENVNKIADNINQIKQNLKGNNKLVIVTDIPGGSVNNKLMELIDNNVFLVSGMNLPLLLNLILEENINKNTIENSIEIGRNNLKLIEFKKKKTINDEEDFFD